MDVDPKLLSGETVIFFSITEWTALPVSHMFIASILKRQNRVIYVESPGNRAPKLCEVGRIFGRLRRALGPAQSRRLGHLSLDGITLRSPLALPWHNTPVVRGINRQLMRRFCRQLKSECGGKQPIAWVFAPRWVDAIDALDPKLVIFQSVDDLTTYAGLDHPYAVDQIERMYRRADLVFIPGRPLFQNKRGENRHTHHIPNGTDWDVMQKSFDPHTPPAAPLAKQRRPRLTYVGSLTDWVDYSLLRKVARARPAWSINLVGPKAATVDPEAYAVLDDCPNVHWIGEYPYLSLPEIYRASDVLLLPYVNNRNRQFANPTKIFEYLVTGLPIVSTDVASVIDFSEHLYLTKAGDASAFLAGCEQALGERTLERNLARRAAGRSHTWQARVERMSACIRQRLACREACASSRAA